VLENGRVRTGGTSNSPGVRRLLMAKEKRAASLLTPDDVAELLRVARRTVINMARDGRVPHVRIGRFVRFDPNEIDRWIRDQRR
jgi:excisionase family DNA binding protein